MVSKTRSREELSEPIDVLGDSTNRNIERPAEGRWKRKKMTKKEETAKER